MLCEYTSEDPHSQTHTTGMKRANFESCFNRNIKEKVTKKRKYLRGDYRNDFEMKRDYKTATYPVICIWTFVPKTRGKPSYF